ncbi:ABC transporter substrate-binding protein [Campylobacter peloridis]|uniref:ABC transporter substrate-binding protein n=1 Tax=Campylobacter peloridis TaxID=488546 RepID=A0ABX6TSM2_9BACT|nr:ABC transporter substrate-binding protein [Campylobacter peloridis]AJC85028.1 high-affinity branched-chain amino acid transporter, periplasmic Leu/Ile/Val-binding protein [Campylobacter peloridis LMG 23910]QOQ89063.1 ABC transporter substrate-binding protein [Campylobacter peloridis]
MKKISIAILSIIAANIIHAKEINIGVVLPLTGSTAAYGQSALDGIKVANSMKNTLSNGDKINLVVVDTKGDKIESANASTRLVSQNKAYALIGEMLTANTLQVIRIGEEKKVPVVAPAATADKILNKKMYASRVCFMDSFQGSSLASYVKNKLNYNKAIIISDQSADYSLGLTKAFEKEFSKQGGKILDKFRVTAGDKDFKAIISQIKLLNPDFIYLPLYYTEASLFVRQAKSMGLNIPMGSADGVADETFINLAQDAAEGYIFTDSFDYHNPPTQLSKDFILAYEKEKQSKEVPNFSAMGADAYFVIFEAMQKCINDFNTECINNNIHSTSKFEGVSGVISIDKSGNATRSIVIKSIENQKQVYKDIIFP